MFVRALLASASLLLLAGCGGGGGSTPAPPVVTPTPPSVTNQPPHFTSAAAVLVDENTLVAYRPEAVDPEGKPLNFTIEGRDADKFKRDDTGFFYFVLAPNFESPLDSNRDNIFEVVIVVDDSENLVRLNVKIMIRDVADSVNIRRIGTGFTEVVSINAIPGTDDMLVAQKNGRVFRVDPSSSTRTLLFRVDDMLFDAGIGLLGASAAPGFSIDGAVLVTFVNNDGNLWLHGYAPNSLGDYAGRATPVLTTPAPNRANPGGWLGLSPEDELYVLVSANGTTDSSNPNSAISKVLRFARNSDPNSDIDSPLYVASPNNAIIGSASMAMGLRNPWGASFHGGNFLFVDRGRIDPDEVNVLGKIDSKQDVYVDFNNQYSCNGCTLAGYIPGKTSPNLMLERDLPIPSNDALVGGVVFSGGQSSLAGHYLIADAVNGTILSIPVDDLLAWGEGGTTLRMGHMLHRSGDFIPDAGTLGAVRAFGKDRAGRVYLADTSGQLFSINE